MPSLKPDKDRGLWLSLSRPERTQLRYRYDALLENRNRIAEDPALHPFAHPFHWAAFAAYGA